MRALPIHGAEFELKALFFYKRLIAVSLANRGFQRAQAAARVAFDSPVSTDPELRVPEVPLPRLVYPH